MGNILHAIFVQPFTNLLMFLVAYIPGHDFGVAVIILTAVIRLVLWPLAASQLHSQKKLTAIQPEVNKLKEKYKDDPQKFNQATMELYKEKEVNPFSSCLPLLVQLPFLIGIFYVFRAFASENYAVVANGSGIVTQLYPFVKSLPQMQNYLAGVKTISTNFLGAINLAKPNIYLAGVAAVAQFIQSKMLLPKQDPNTPKDPASSVTNQMVYFFPAITFVIALTLPSALPLFWIVTPAVAILQQYLVFHRDVEAVEEEAAVETGQNNKETLRLAQGGGKPRRKKHAGKRRRR
jgi:YidC/Oxa1 family membrane protein insertase